jgi:hypothetical protein
MSITIFVRNCHPTYVKPEFTVNECFSQNDYDMPGHISFVRGKKKGEREKREVENAWCSA